MAGPDSSPLESLLPSLGRLTEDSKKVDHGCRMIYAGVPSFFGGLGTHPHKLNMSVL